MMAPTSTADIGVGLSPVPTKAVTPCVVRTASQEMSSRIILTRIYPGKIFSFCSSFLPCLTVTTFLVGTMISKILSESFMVSMRCLRLVATLFSCPE